MVTQRVTRDLQALERRRKQAARLFAKGNLPQASVARELKVSRMSVSRWHRQWKKSGKEALKAAPRAGRKPLLNPRQVHRVQAALRKGARAHGFSADLWTLPRVATVIERIAGVASSSTIPRLQILPQKSVNQRSTVALLSSLDMMNSIQVVV